MKKYKNRTRAYKMRAHVYHRTKGILCKSWYLCLEVRSSLLFILYFVLSILYNSVYTKVNPRAASKVNLLISQFRSCVNAAHLLYIYDYFSTNFIDNLL